VTVILVRHAAAGERSRWAGDDRLRPLDELGRRQAAGLAEALASRGVERVLTSPFVRCRQTVDPLAEALGLAVEERVELAEGAGAAAVVQLVGRLHEAVSVLCTHGDVVAAVLGEESEKGSAWLLEPEADGGLSPREYVRPAV
jgi:phosphohistidine phosphatase SixA